MTTVSTGARLEVENTVGTSHAITALTKANPGVATSLGHGLSNGDTVKIAVSSGMRQLDGQVCRVANITVDTFELENVNTTNFSDWESGGGTFQEVTAWYTVSPATDVDGSNASPTELDASTLLDEVGRTIYGRAGAKSGSVAIQDDPLVSAVQKLESASQSDLLAFRITWSNGSLKLFGAYTAYDGGFNAQGNSIVTGSFPISVPAKIVSYAS